jgi:hypothetical protein
MTSAGSLKVKGSLSNIVGGLDGLQYTAAKVEHPLNTYEPIAVTFPGIVMLFKAMQWANAPSPSLVILSGNVMSVKALHSKKTFSSNVLSPLDKCDFLKIGAFAKGVFVERSDAVRDFNFRQCCAFVECKFSDSNQIVR